MHVCNASNDIKYIFIVPLVSIFEYGHKITLNLPTGFSGMQLKLQLLFAAVLGSILGPLQIQNPRMLKSLMQSGLAAYHLQACPSVCYIICRSLFIPNAM